MKKAAYILVGALLGSGVPAKAQAFLWPTEKGAELFVSVRMANLRSAPSATAGLVDSLPCGSAVQVLEAGTTSLTISGIETPWLKVRYRKDNTDKEAFIWLGLLALGGYRSGGTQFLYGVDRIVPGPKEKDYTPPAAWQVSVKALDSVGTLLDQAAFTVQDVEVAGTAGKMLGSLGLRNAKDILRILFGGEACGIPTYYYYYAWTGSRFLPLPGKMEVSEAGSFYHTETLLFPGEPGGQPDKLILLTEEGEEQEGKVDKEGNPVFKVSKSRRVYLWDGEKAMPQVALKR
ncbi:MAG TPA: SH3 domain-containing protein [Chitinophagaceae bacterium]|nr:SH3 domain-containing protein [Chitinophagaceae bacterium]